jgi:hypothetical protein
LIAKFNVFNKTNNEIVFYLKLKVYGMQYGKPSRNIKLIKIFSSLRETKSIPVIIPSTCALRSSFD